MKGVIRAIRDGKGVEHEYYELNYIRINKGKLTINYTDIYGEVHEEIEDVPEYLYVFAE